MLFIQRIYSRTEHDDFVLNVQPKLNNYNECLDVRDSNGGLMGWKIIPRFS